jgi:hypothetical protein
MGQSSGLIPNRAKASANGEPAMACAQERHPDHHPNKRKGE